MPRSEGGEPEEKSSRPGPQQAGTRYRAPAEPLGGSPCGSLPPLSVPVASRAQAAAHMPLIPWTLATARRPPEQRQICLLSSAEIKGLKAASKWLYNKARLTYIYIYIYIYIYPFLDMEPSVEQAPQPRYLPPHIVSNTPSNPFPRRPDIAARQTSKMGASRWWPPSGPSIAAPDAAHHESPARPSIVIASLSACSSAGSNSATLQFGATCRWPPSEYQPSGGHGVPKQWKQITAQRPEVQMREASGRLHVLPAL